MFMSLSTSSRNTAPVPAGAPDEGAAHYSEGSVLERRGNRRCALLATAGRRWSELAPVAERKRAKRMSATAGAGARLVAHSV